MDTSAFAGGAPYPTLAQVWDPEADDALVCLDVHQETHDVKSFTFASVAGKQFDVRAGQYFLFTFPAGGEDDSRCYSVSSSPLRRNAFSITVKRVAGGRMSNWLHDTMQPGMSVTAQGPLGTFIRPAGAAQKYLLLSGGSGITPVMSMVRELADSYEQADVAFVHAGRAPADLIFRHELSGLAARLKTLRLHFLPEQLGNEPSWPGLTGRISLDYLRLAVPDLAERVILCCGPQPFMAAARKIAAEAGVPAHRYIEESFDAAVIDADVVTPIQAPAETIYAVQFSKQARSIDVSAEQTVLSCAKKAGIRIPSSCANGMCGTCKSKLVSGSVNMVHNGGIRQREIDAGFFLPCCSKPTSDLVIDR
ncbi:FAD-binding oxidoreductase [Tianweitania populi]|uniref:Hybrid-cluster NAD(P)-dependent oxidoreductase n=1 Tax=Tianweitania populi TaxID=1607949 RepID=A0A8J3DW97_9HYPH|nr:hybrid-cluster NAD(P)-dependent oxidoreductase [Tianweitania populi]